MKKTALLLIALVFAASGFAQKKSKKSDANTFPYTFEVVKDNSHTSTKDQCRTGTCWSFATISFVESELIRMGKGEHNLSEMFNVRVTYPKKAENYVRYQGRAQFGPGSLSHDVINAIRDYGMVPEEAYSGLNPGVTEHNHGELDAMLEGLVKGVTEVRGSKTDAYKKAVDAVLDATLGRVPKKFAYQGKEYTPESFRDAMGFNASDYVSLSSFTHHAMWEPFILEVPDNFSQGQFYNVPIEDLGKVAQNALGNGYTVAWDADVSERGFSFRNGMAILPVDGTSKDDMFKKVVAEQTVTQEKRQEAFDMQSTTDDHLMHITGMSKDQNGNMYYITKNSWGTGNSFDGFQHVSEAYFNMKTVGIMVHKDAIPADIRSKLGL